MQRKEAAASLVIKVDEELRNTSGLAGSEFEMEDLRDRLTFCKEAIKMQNTEICRIKAAIRRAGGTCDVKSDAFGKQKHFSGTTVLDRCGVRSTDARILLLHFMNRNVETIDEVKGLRQDLSEHVARNVELDRSIQTTTELLKGTELAKDREINNLRQRLQHFQSVLVLHRPHNNRSH
eukprot:GABV01008687.1.p2 GENE.GABV01008687.1~~GABV01008687.1.p2  ORF type:complete len:178 (-),score=23.11 GABV01008687.1:341-874(-)